MSSRKNTLLKYNMVVAGSLGANFTSSPVNIQYLDNIGIQLNFTGTPTGVFYIQISADYQVSQGVVINAGNWVNLNVTASAAGAADNAYFDITLTSAPWIRIFYSRTSGTGTLNAFLTAKMV